MDFNGWIDDLKFYSHIRMIKGDNDSLCAMDHVYSWKKDFHLQCSLNMEQLDQYSTPYSTELLGFQYERLEGWGIVLILTTMLGVGGRGMEGRRRGYRAIAVPIYS